MSMYIGDFGQRSGGLADAVPSHLMLPGRFASLRNLIHHEGSIVKRWGTRWMATSSRAADCKGMHFAYDQANNRVTRIFQISTFMQYWNGTGLTDVVGFPGVTASLYPSFESYNNLIYYANGTQKGTITVAAAPTYGAWTMTGLPGGFVPSLITIHKDRMYALKDEDLYISQFGDPSTYDVTEAYKLPGNKSGRYVKFMKSFGTWIGLFCNDYTLGMRGTGLFSHRIDHMPKGPAFVSPRAIVNYNGTAVGLTNLGPMQWDGVNTPRPLDPYNQVNWSDVNFKDVNHTFMLRDDDNIYLFYRTKGPARVASLTVASTLRGYLTVVYAYLTRLLRVALASIPTYNSNFVVIDMKNNKISGPHDGEMLSGFWEDWNLGDEHNVWFGSARADGKIYKMAPDLFVDEYGDSSVNSGAGKTFPTELITGALHGVGAEGENPMDAVSIDQIRLQVTAQSGAGGEILAYVAFNEDIDVPALGPFKVPISQIGPRGGDRARSAEEKKFDRKRVVQHDIIVNTDRSTKNSGWVPQLILKEESAKELQYRMIQVITSSGRG